MSKGKKKDQKEESLRKKSIESLKKKDIIIKDEDKISGGAIDLPNWLETPKTDEEL